MILRLRPSIMSNSVWSPVLTGLHCFTIEGVKGAAHCPFVGVSEFLALRLTSQSAFAMSLATHDYTMNAAYIEVGAEWTGRWTHISSDIHLFAQA